MLLDIKIESRLIRLESEMVSLEILLVNITEVSEIFNFALILFDKEIVSLANLFVIIADVSEMLSFLSELVSVAIFRFLICLDTNKVVAIVLSATVES